MAGLVTDIVVEVAALFANWDVEGLPVSELAMAAAAKGWPVENNEPVVWKESPVVNYRLYTTIVQPTIIRTLEWYA